MELFLLLKRLSVVKSTQKKNESFSVLCYVLSIGLRTMKMNRKERTREKKRDASVFLLGK